jgi:hypothetical protein
MVTKVESRGLLALGISVMERAAKEQCPLCWPVQSRGGHDYSYTGLVPWWAGV